MPFDNSPPPRPSLAHAYLLLTLAALFWSGNFIVGREVRDVVPPVALAFWRWSGGFLIVLPLAWPHLRRDLPELLRRWPMLLLLSATGIACYNTFIYIGLGTTTALNALLMQSAMPLVIIAWSFALFGERPGWLPDLAVLVSLLGVLTIVTGGEPWALAEVTLNRGDLWVFVAVVTYALYSALLRKRPSVHPASFIAATFLIGTAMLAPLYLREIGQGLVIHPEPRAWMALVYVATFPAVAAYFCWNRGVQLVGANRAGQFFHLMPVFGSGLAILVLGEEFRAYHAAGAALIFLGIVLAVARRP